LFSNLYSECTIIILIEIHTASLTEIAKGDYVLSLTERNKVLIYRISFVIVTVSIFVLTLIKPSQLFSMPDISDKIQHAVAFFVLAFLADKSFFVHRYLLIKSGGLLAFGVLIEWAQSFTSYRSSDWHDVLADLAGILLYWLIIKVTDSRI